MKFTFRIKASIRSERGNPYITTEHYFEQGQMTVEQAQELKTMLEELRTRALDDGDLNTARDIASILITLKGFLNGRISLTVDKVSVS